MIHIGITEDSSNHLQLLEKYIQSSPHFKIDFVAQNGQAMLQYLHKSKKLPNVVIVDYEMNPVDGLQLAYYIHLHFPTVKILALSGHIHQFAIKNMYACGCNGYKSKYFLSNLSDNLQHLLTPAIKEFLDAIQQINEGQFYVDSYFTNQNLYDFETIKIKQLNKTHNDTISKKKFHFELSKKQYQILYLISIGFTSHEIAEVLCISEHTANNHMSELKKKLKASNQKDLMVQAYRNQLVPCASYEYIGNMGGGKFLLN